MSIEAITWALHTAPIPTGRNASTLAFVLVGLANPDGHNAFPAVATLVRYTRLSERSVQYALRTLEDLGLITPSDPDIVAAYVKRADRRPKGWDLPIHNTIHRVIHNGDYGVQSVHPVSAHEVQTQPHRVQTTTSRGAQLAPEPSLNHPMNRPAHTRARHDAEPAGVPGVPPLCGQCDARDTDPVSARVIWLDTDRQRSTPCPRCHPLALASGGWSLTTANGHLVTQVRHLIDQAHQQGRHRPGRPTLVQLTGASDHEIRKALAELATEPTSTGEQHTNPDGYEPGGSRPRPHAPGDEPLAWLTSTTTSSTTTSMRTARARRACPPWPRCRAPAGRPPPPNSTTSTTTSTNRSPTRRRPPPVSPLVKAPGRRT